MPSPPTRPHPWPIRSMARGGAMIGTPHVIIATPPPTECPWKAAAALVGAFLAVLLSMYSLAAIFGL